jgi:hypothetical protein
MPCLEPDNSAWLWSPIAPAAATPELAFLNFPARRGGVLFGPKTGLSERLFSKRTKRAGGDITCTFAESCGNLVYVLSAGGNGVILNTPQSASGALARSRRDERGLAN